MKKGDILLWPHRNRPETKTQTIEAGDWEGKNTQKIKNSENTAHAGQALQNAAFKKSFPNTRRAQKGEECGLKADRLKVGVRRTDHSKNPGQKGEEDLVGQRTHNLQKSGGGESTTGGEPRPHKKTMK